MSETRPPPLKVPRLLLTGAAGGLGRELRSRLKPHCERLRLSDIANLGVAAAGEELFTTPLENAEAVLALLDGVDAVVHLGGVSTEQPWSAILPANIVGVFNLYEAARQQGVKRVVLASSNHVTGYYRQDEFIDTRAPARPDGLYGVSKAYAEDLSRLYFDRHGVETACLRIGSCSAEPLDRRMLSTWLSFDDLERLVLAALTVPVLGHAVVYGVSANDVLWWDNRHAAHLGYRPQDSSAPYRAAIQAGQPALDPSDPAAVFQGGTFTRTWPCA
jgi:uronate dehydrogenase